MVRAGLVLRAGKTWPVSLITFAGSGCPLPSSICSPGKPWSQHDRPVRFASPTDVYTPPAAAPLRPQLGVRSETRQRPGALAPGATCPGAVPGWPAGAALGWPAGAALGRVAGAPPAVAPAAPPPATASTAT